MADVRHVLVRYGRCKICFGELWKERLLLVRGDKAAADIAAGEC